MHWDEYIAEGILDGGPDATYIDDGAIKPTFRIDTDSRSYVLQTVTDGEGYRLHKQRELYTALEDTDVPVPSVVHDATDRTVPYQVLDHVDGAAPDRHSDLADEKLARLTEEAGRHLATAHRELDQDGYGWMGGTADGLTVDDEGWHSFYRSFLDHHLDLLRDSPLDQDGLVEDAETAVEETMDELPEDPYAAVCHRDYRPGNLLADAGGINAVLDWDNAFAGDPRYDLVRSEQSFAGDLDDRIDEPGERFRQAYEEVGGSIDQRIHDIYGLGARLDHGAATVWLLDNGYDFPDHVVQKHTDAIDSAIDRIER